MQLLAQQPLASDWTSTRPALLRLVSGAGPAFIGVRPVTRAPPRFLPDPDLDHDGRAVEAMATLRKAGIPVAVLHSPLLPELLDRQILVKFTGTSQGYVDTLLASWQRLTGRPLLRMTDLLDRETHPDPAQVVNNPQGDWQLREAGTRLYADLAARALLPTIATIVSR